MFTSLNARASAHIEERKKQQQQQHNTMGLMDKIRGEKKEEQVTATSISTLETETRVIEKEAIVNTVVDKPVLDKVLEKKHVEVHHKNVVQEIHEQPILEVEKTAITKVVSEPTEIKKVLDEQTTYDPLEKPVLSKEEQERLDLVRKGEFNKPETQIANTATVNTIHDTEEVREIIIQPIIERHQQQLITEIHDKKIIEIHEHPVVRKIIEKPIVREIVHAE